MRWVPYTQQRRDSESDAFLGLLNNALTLRPSDEGAISLTWVEHYGAKCTATYVIAAVAFRGSLKDKRLPTKSYFAIGKARTIRSVATSFAKPVRLIHAPDGTNTGHVEMRRFSDDDRRLLDALTAEAFVEHVAVAGLNIPK